MEKSARTRLVTAAVLAVVFGAGIVVGMALKPGESGEAAEVASATQRTDSAGRRRRPPLYMQVNPTDEQKARLDSLLKENHEAMRALTKEFHDEYDPRYQALSEEYHAKYDPRYDSLIASTRAAIRRVLTPEQVVKYDSLTVRADARIDSLRASGERRRADRGGRDRE